MLFVALLLPANLSPQAAMPLIVSVEPVSCKAGDVLSAQGANLGPDLVAELYLTDGKIDLKLRILQQSSKSISFKIPVEVKPGRYAVMVLTRESEPKLIEQPVKLTVDSDSTS